MDKKNIQELVFSILKESFSGEISNNDYQDICKYIYKNKIPFIEIDKKAHLCTSFINSKEFQKYLNEENNLYKQWLNDFEDVKNAWEKEGIEYLFHKSIGKFPHQSDNLDLLVRTKDYNRAGELLVGINYINLRHIQEAHKEFYRKFDGNIAKGPIHLHERVCWVVPYDDIDHIWKHKMHSNDEESVYYLHPNDSLITQAIHCFIEDHVIKAKDILFVKDCIEKHDIDWDYVIKTAEKNYFDHALYTSFIVIDYLHKSNFGYQLIPQNILDKCWAYVKKRNWINNKLEKILKEEPTMPFYLPHLWSRIHSSLREILDPIFGNKLIRFYQVFGSLFDRFLHLKLKVHNQPSFHIAISGCDGSGKSTYINNLTQNFKDCDVKTKVFWHRSGSMPITKAVNNIRRIILGKNKQNTEIKINDKQKIQNPVLNFIWRMLYAIDIIFYNLKKHYHLLLGKVVISDRYFIDDIVDIENINVTKNTDRFIYKLLKNLIHKPDLHYFIDTKADIIRQRVGSDIIEDIENNIILYKKIIINSDIKIADNSAELNKEYNKVTHSILCEYFKKYPQKYYGYIVKSYTYK